MHTNHRRPIKFRAKHHNRRSWALVTSLKWYRRQKTRARRVLERVELANGRYDTLPAKEHRCILYEYW